MVFVILVSHEDPVKSTLGFHVAINHPEGKLIIYTAFYLKIQVEMDKAKSIKPCKKKKSGHDSSYLLYKKFNPDAD